MMSFSKIEQFFELYMEDRKHFLSAEARQQGLEVSQLDIFKATSPISLPSTSFAQPGLSGQRLSSIKPKSILISQPNSPISDDVPSSTRLPTFTKKSHRGYLDAGGKTKKRVTLSSTCSNYPDSNPSNPTSPSTENVTIVVPQAISTTSSIEASTSAQSLSINLELTDTTPRSETSFNYDEKDQEEEVSEKIDQFEDQDDNEEEINETTLLCPTTQNEIIITPSTLNCTSKIEVGTEDIYMKNFKPISKKVKDL